MASLNHLSVADLHELESIPPLSEMRVPERLHLLDNEYRLIHVGDVAEGVSEEYIVFVAATKCEITACSFVSAAAVAGDDTNYNIYKLYKGGAGGDAIGTVNTKTTGGTDGSTEYVADSIGALDATHRVLDEGDVVTFDVDEDTGGTGKALVDLTILLRVVPVDGGE